MLGVAQLINEASNYETNKDWEVALRLYKTAFNNLLDLNSQISTTTITVVPGVSPFEIRSVADYLNFRTCKIQFVLDHPREAITQFKKYIDTFRQHTRSPEYAFEHAAWLSQQYLMFADTFNDGVCNGVKASKAQHPGIYYHEAAMQMIIRRQNITEYTNDTIRSNQMPVTNELLSMITTSNFVSFLCQCGWTCIDSNAGPPVAPIKPQNPDAQVKTTTIDYSKIIIRALYKASEYFQEWNRPRMVSRLNIMIADEYFLCRKFPKALALYNENVSLYERESWKPLIESIREKIISISEEQSGT